MSGLEGAILAFVVICAMIGALVGWLCHFPAADEDDNFIDRGDHHDNEDLYRFSKWHSYHSDDEFDDK